MSSVLVSPQGEKLLFGIKAIHGFVQSLIEREVTPRQVTYWIEKGYLPVETLGPQKVGNPAKIRARLMGDSA